MQKIDIAGGQTIEPAPRATRQPGAMRQRLIEEYHQDYYKKNPLRYRFYRFSCGRDARLKQAWRDEAGGGER